MTTVKVNSPDMLKNRKFKVVLVNGKSGTGDAPMKGGKSVNSVGKKTSIRL